MLFASVAPHGYNASISLLIGVSPAGEVTGVRAVRHRETTGLGDAIDAAKSDWIEQFTGKTLAAPAAALWAVEQDDGEFDSITGATVTSRAVVTAVKNTLLYFEQHRDELYAAAAAAAADADDDERRRNSFREATAGLWRNNVALVQLLGLCPLLAVTTSLVNGLALGVVTAAVLVVASTRCRCMRRVLLPAVRVPLYLLLLAALVTSLDLLTHAMLYELHEALGLFMPLIVVNCGLLAHAENVASRRPVGFVVVVRASQRACGFLFALMALGGAARDLLGHGTLLAGIEMLTGEAGAGLDRRAAVRWHARRDSAARRASSPWRCCSRCATA